MTEVLHIAGSCYPAQTGGVDNAVYWYAFGQKSAGLKVNVYTTDIGQPSDTIKNEKIATEFGEVTYWRALAHYLPLRWALASSLKILSFKGVIHLHGLLYSAMLIPALFLRRGPTIISVHGELDRYARESGSVHLKKLSFALYRFLGNRVNFHATCQAEAIAIGKILAPQKEVLQETIGMRFQEIQPHNPVKPYFSFIGRINHIKGVDRLIKAVAASVEFRQWNGELRIAGETNSSEYHELLALVKEKGLEDSVLFVGSIVGEEKERFLANAHFNFMPSHTENFGIVTLEALAQHTPAVASIYTPWEILESEKVGFWVDNDVDTLAKTIDQILTMNDNEYQGMRSRARTVAETNFAAEVIGARWLDLYQRIHLQLQDLG